MRDAAADAIVRPADSLVGTVLADRYRVEQLIGEGGMGAVYRAVHVHMHKTFAIKILHQQLTAVEEAVKRFEREAIAAARIQHHNVATAIDFGQLDNGLFYLVLEYVPGESLAELLATRGALPLQRSLFVAHQIAAALRAAHSVGIVHRDLKPDNVMLIEKGDVSDFVKVLDFGIAKIAADVPSGDAQLTVFGSIFGTPQYMAPEQAAGRTVDLRVDLYALGLILYEMLSGKPAFDANDILPLLTMQMTAAPPTLPAHVPEDVRELVMNLLQKEPAKRPQSAQQVARRIEMLAERYASEVVSEARPVLASAVAIRDSTYRHQIGHWFQSASRVAKNVTARHVVPGARNLLRFVKRRSLKPLTKRVSAALASSVGSGRSSHGRQIRRRLQSASRRVKKVTLRRVVPRARALLAFAKRRSIRQVPNWVFAAIGLTILALVLSLHLASQSAAAGSEPKRQSETEAKGLPGKEAEEKNRRPSGEAALDPELQRVIAEARQGKQSALYALEQRSDRERTQYEWLALAQGRLKRQHVTDALTAYEKALDLDSNLATDDRMLAGLRYLAGTHSSYEMVLEFAANHMGAAGADLIFHVWSATSRTTPYTRKAKELLEDGDVRKNMSQALRLAMDLRGAQSCEKIKKLLPDIVKNGDDRSLTRLKELSKTGGCGDDKKDDCYPCLRDSALLHDAITQVQGRPTPRFSGRRWR